MTYKEAVAIIKLQTEEQMDYWTRQIISYKIAGNRTKELDADKAQTLYATKLCTLQEIEELVISE